jgi:hypothetical protein
MPSVNDLAELHVSRRSWRALWAIDVERDRQDAKWGEQNLRDGSPTPKRVVDAIRRSTDYHAKNKYGRGLAWRHVLDEEVAEAYGAIGDDAALREELVQVAAVAVAWIEAIDRRNQ